MQMRKQYHIIGILLLCNLYSCNHNSKNNNNINKKKHYDIIEVDIDNAKPGKLSDFYKSIRYVKLETKSPNYLPPCRIMKVIEDRIYLGSQYPHNKIFVFNKSGKFLFQIGSEGKGPGEWLSMRDFIVREDCIIAIDKGTRSFLQFDLNGRFVEKTSLNDLHISSISKYKGDTVIGYINNQPIFYAGNEIKSNLIFFSLKTQQLLADALPIPNCKLGHSHFGTDCFLNIDNKRYFFEQDLDTIYQIGDNFTVKPQFVLDFGKYSVTPEKRPKSFKDWDEKIKLFRKYPGLVYYVHGLTGNKNTLFFGFARAINRHPYLYYVYYSLNTKTSKCVTKLIDDLSLSGIKMEFTAKNPLTSVNGEQIWMMEPAEFLEEYNKLKNKYGLAILKERNPKLTEIFENTTDIDNPILVFLKFKD